jgi:hypothetical protein
LKNEVSINVCTHTVATKERQNKTQRERKTERRESFLEVCLASLS